MFNRLFRAKTNMSRKQFRSRLQAARRFEALEERRMLAADLDGIEERLFGGSYVPNDPARAIALVREITAHQDPSPVFIPDLDYREFTDVELPGWGSEPLDPLDGSAGLMGWAESGGSGFYDSLAAFRADSRFQAIDGTGFTSVIIDSGADLDHPHFGPDADGDGIADRIVHQQSFTGGASAEDDNGHGTHVQGIVGSSDGTYPGVATGVNLVALKTQGANGSGRFSAVEQALRWVVDNATTHNIASVNMSIGDNGFYTEAIARYGLGDELAALEAMDVIVVSASGNNFFSGRIGVSYPSADPNSLSVGSERTRGGLSSFSQRDPEQTTVFAPGQVITAAWPGGGVRGLQGTSMASPQVAGVAVLAQQLATEVLGRRLTTTEFTTLMRMTGPDTGSIPETGSSYPGVDMLALGEEIIAMNASTIDLEVTQLNVTGGEKRGDSMTVNYTVTNQGTSVSNESSVDVFLSRNGEISWTGDYRLGAFSIPALTSGQSTSGAVTVALPGANDTFWDSDTTYTLGTLADPLFMLSEANETNNLNTPSSTVELTIENLPRNLLGDNIGIVNTDGFWGGAVELAFDVLNTGEGPSAATRTGVFLSATPTISVADSLLLDSIATPRINGGEKFAASVSLNLPSPDDPFWDPSVTTYYLGVASDYLNNEAESSETDNLNRGIGEDIAQLTLAPPASNIFGTLYEDSVGDGSFQPRFTEVFSEAHIWPGRIPPFSAQSFRFTELPTYRSSAELIVRVRGDVGSATNSLSISLDGLVNFTLFQGEQPEGSGEIHATRTVPLHGEAWLEAVSDREVLITADVNFGSSFSNNLGNFIEVTLVYRADSETQAAASSFHPDAVFRGTTTFALESNHPASGDVTLEIMAAGLLGGSDRNANLMLENGQSFSFFTDTPPSNDRLVYDRESITIPAAIYNDLISDGALLGELTFSNAVSAVTFGASFEVRVKYPIVSSEGVGGQVVMLDLGNDGTIDRTTISSEDDPSTPNNEAGNYVFPGVPSGSHRVIRQSNADWSTTSPPSGEELVTVMAGQSVWGAHFSLHNLPDTTPPKISNVFARSSQWSPGFLAAIGNPLGLSLTGDHQLMSLPWVSGVDQFSVQFTEDVGGSLTHEAVVIRGAEEINVVRSDAFQYDPETFTLTVTSAAPVTADRMMISVFDTVSDGSGNRLDGEWITAESTQSGDGMAGGQFDFSFHVLAGDVDSSGAVNFSGDVLGVYSQIGVIPESWQEAVHDVNHDGAVNFSGDVLATFALITAVLPSNGPSKPTPPSGGSSFGAAAGSSHGNSGSDVLAGYFTGLPDPAGRDPLRQDPLGRKRLR